MAVLSKFGYVAIATVLSIGSAIATATLFYVLSKNSEDNEYKLDRRSSTTKGNKTILEIKVPTNVVGNVIGRFGNNIKCIQKETNTSIRFRDDVNEEFRVAIVQGSLENVQLAEQLIKKQIQERSDIQNFEFTIPASVCGRVIGKNGTVIRQIIRQSFAKVRIEDCSHLTDSEGKPLATVTITGTASEIDFAKALIDEKIEEPITSDKNTLNVATKGRFKDGQLCLTYAEEFDTELDSYGGKIEKLLSNASDGFLEIFVANVKSPSSFWVQPVGPRAKELDKLIEVMTSYYNELENQQIHKLLEIKIGDLVSAPFPHDEMWYRARILSVDENEYDPESSIVEIYYLDFGEFAKLKRAYLYILKDDFLQLPFQAVQCELDNVCSRGEEWDEEAIQTFRDITYATEWKKLMCCPLHKNENNVYRVEIVDTNKKYDTNIAEELVKRGYANWKKEKKPKE